MRELDEESSGQAHARTRVRPAWMVAGGAIVYTVLLSGFSIAAHLGLKTNLIDLGHADQALWAAAGGDLAMVQVDDTDGRLRSRLGIHANLIFWPLSLLYRVGAGPTALLVLTSLACAAAGVGLYAFARHHLGDSSWSLVPPLAFWLSPIVHDANLYDFHVITLTTALLVWAVWAFDAARRKTAWVLVVAALLCKEDVALITFMLGLYLTVTGRRRSGVGVCLLSVLYFVLVCEVIAPAFNEGRGLERLEGTGNRYAWLGAGPVEMLHAVVTDPGRVLRHISRPDHLRLPAYLLLCGGLAGLRAWRLLVLLLPPLAMGMLCETSWMTHVTGTYYWITSEAIIIMACVLATQHLWQDRPSAFPWPLAYLGSASVVLTFLLSPLPHGIWSTWDNYTLPAERAALRDLRERIPEDAPLSVQSNIGPHFAHRRDVAGFPQRLDTAEYALVQLRRFGGPDAGLFLRTSPMLHGMLPRALVDRTRGMIAAPRWGLVYQRDGFYLFARDAEDRVDRAAALAQLDADATALLHSHARAARYRSSWARYLVGDLTWRALFAPDVAR